MTGVQTCALPISADLLGRFFDATDSYRFGPRVHDLAHARLSEADGTVVAEAFHFLGPRPGVHEAVGLRVEPALTEAGPALRIATERLAFGVQIDASGANPADTGFHLAPGTVRTIAFPGADRLPRGHVRAINSNEILVFGPDA